MSKYISIFLFLFLFVSCRDGNRIEINRLDAVLADYALMGDDQRIAVMDSLGDVVGVWFRIQGKDVVNDSLLIEYSKSKAVSVFYSDVCAAIDKNMFNFNVVEKLEYNICNQFGDSAFYRVYSVISPYNQSVFISDKIMFVGLNHYLGCDYPGYNYFEPYQRITKTPQHLVYDITEATLKDKFSYEKKDDETVLNVLLYNGAIVYAMMKLIPDADLAEALGYSNEQLAWTERNEKEAWNALISRNLLYSANQHDVVRLVNPSPATSILHPESPGRLGRYLGYKIVESYVKSHPNVDLEWLLSAGFYNSVQSLIDSGYGF